MRTANRHSTASVLVRPLRVGGLALVGAVMGLWGGIGVAIAADGGPLAGDAGRWAVPFPLSETVAEGDRFQGIRLLAGLRLPRVRIDGLPLTELSGLAWDRDEGMLYLLSDHGNLFHARLVLEAGRLVDLRPVAAYPLRDRSGHPLRGKLADAEGLEIEAGNNGRTGDARLLVSFERRPRILRFDPRGRWAGALELPRPLASRSNYRSENKALEALAMHPKWGVLTAAEWPLRDAASTRAYTLYNLHGRRWSLARSKAPKSALVAVEALPDGGLLTLERSFVSVWKPLIGILRRTQPLPGGMDGTAAQLKSREVAVLDSTKGWWIDNFEGLTRLSGSRFLMVSDDNDRALQHTLLMYFELLPDRRDR
jgi:hypothetical protein